ncbi:glycoside hydrolase family 99-like domain-containing protein [Methylocaldum gracile]
MNNSKQERIVVVLGMHRSGTSAITRSLDLLGVNLGDNLHPPGFDNPKGFWEDKDCLEINEQLLAYFGSAYDKLSIPSRDSEPDSFITELKSKAVRLITSRIASHNGKWGFKDPRTCRFLGFWRSVFDACGCDVYFVIALRNPLSVALSLEKRNRISIEKGYLLWLEHILPTVLNTIGSPRLVIDYDLLMESPLSQVARISSILGLPTIDEDSPAFQDYANNFLEKALRHTTFSVDDLQLDRRAPIDVVTAYQTLLKAAKDEVSLEDKDFLDCFRELRARFNTFSPVFFYINTLEEQNAAFYTQVTSLDQTVAERDQQIIERAQQISNLNQTIAERDNQIATLHREKDAFETRLNHILVSRSWRLTEPFRALRRGLTTILGRDLHCDFFTVIRPVWHRLPLSVPVKQKFKSALFITLPFLFRGTQAYRNWQNFSAPFVNSAGTFFPLMPRDSWLPNTRKEYVPLLKGRPIENKPVKLICFYLPQFHAIPENDAWWGKGFTEWSNVQPALPQFAGHYQPRIPDELGYYNLLDPAVQRRQIELAKLYGIEGFCFYFYWFGGKRLLEAPIKNYLNDISLDLPFCLCWANENWSRRWDGLDSEVLIAQEHSPEDDIAFIQYVARYMRDRRYIRIDGKPLLLVYRPSLLPSAKETSRRWRQWCRDNDIGEIYLAYTQSFETIDPIKYGFDAAIEFPPNNSAPPNLTNSVTPLDKNFGCTVYDWRTFVERSEHYKSPGYKLFRGVCPSWDNTARRKSRSTVFLNSSPSLYQRWLENAIRCTQQSFTNPDEQLVFINAWNEWAEGAYLEPDARFGYAYLQATRNALTGSQMFPREERKVVLVTHDAYPHGAQLLALNLARTLNEEFGFHIDVVCLEDGPLKSDFARWARVHDLNGKDPRGQQAVSLAERLYESGHRCALVNTTVSGYFLETLASNGFRCVALIHELHGVLNQMGLQGQAKTIADHASKIVFPASEVAVSFNAIAPCESAKVHIRPQGLYKRRDKSVDRFTHRKRLRQQLGLPDDAQVVLGVGYADHRKGIDLFVDAGLEMAPRTPRARWVWLGHWEQGMRDHVINKLTKFPELQDRFIFPGLQTDTELFYGGADVFALTSREDPFPSVVLEALDACLPVVGFEGAGGFVGLLSEGCGRLVPKENAEAFASAVADLLEKSGERERLGLRGAELISRLFSFRHYIFDLLDFLGIGLARVSAIIPNYNYARYLPERLQSIVKQDYPIYEIIFLDDCSTDKSVEVAEKLLGECGIDYRILINEENSGSVFRQWRKGVEFASGTHIWLAEADDSCGEKLIDELLKGFRTPGVVLSYCESQQIDELGTLLANNYLPYLSDIDARHWLTPFVLDGESEIVDFLSIKNTIPNVSAVLFSRSALKSVLENSFDEICSYRIAGDWLVYVLLLASGRVAFSPIPLNKHRRHSQGVTISNINKSHLEEIRRMQNYIAERYDVAAAKQNQAKRYIESLQEDHGITVN